MPPPTTTRAARQRQILWPSQGQIPSEADNIVAETQVLSWNINAVIRGTGDCGFLVPLLSTVHVACLQEVTRAALEWLSDALGDDFYVASPQTLRGQAWPLEEHSVAIVYDKRRFHFLGSQVCVLDTRQERCVFLLRLRCLRSGTTLLVATTHLESGDCQPAELRAQQLTHTLMLLAAAPEEAVLLAGDLNIRDWEARRTGIGEDGGNRWFDAWHVAGAEKALASTWKGLRLIGYCSVARGHWNQFPAVSLYRKLRRATTVASVAR